MGDATAGIGDFRGTSRYSILGRIGAGGMGVVYRALDRERTTRVALKLLPKVDPTALYRFKREFRALADVHHPNIVTLYELVSSGDRWFFTMELVEGVDFLTYVRGRAGTGDESVAIDPLLSPALAAGRAPEYGHAGGGSGDTATQDTLGTPTAGALPEAARARRAATRRPAQISLLRVAMRQLAEGVLAMHSAGQLHRDIKPSNVLVEDGRVVIVDFGVVTELMPHGDREVIGLGTPAYVAPEQAAGDAVLEASDWYSVGVMLFEALTGQRPFGGSSADTIDRKQRLDAPLPSELNPEVPEDLDSLCADLIARDPAARPSGAEIVRRLGAGTATAIRLSRRRASTESDLVGRERHVEKLWRTFESIDQRGLQVVHVHGESGLGKTALVRRFLSEVRDLGEVVVLTGRCYERESVPYKALDDLMDALARHLLGLTEDEIRQLVPRSALPLARVFPVLLRVPLIAEAAERTVHAPDPHELRRRAFAGLRLLLARLADVQPLILHIDDVQWGDTESAALVIELLRPPRPPPVMVVMSYRDMDVERSPFLGAYLAVERPDVVDLPVEPLTIDEARALAHRELAGLPGMVEQLARESQGNPLFLAELIRYVTLAHELGETPMPVQISLDRVLRRRFDALPQQARALLEVVAVAGRPISLAIAKQAAGLDEDRDAVGVLRTQNLARTHGAREADLIEAYHDRIREALVSTLAGDVLRALHAVLAATLREADSADAETIAAHYEAAGEGDEAARYCVIAAQKAADALAFDRAADLYRRALALGTATGEAELQLRVALGEALANAGAAEQAAAVYVAAAKAVGPAAALEYRRRAAEQLLRAGNIDDGIEMLRSVLSDVGMKLPATPRRALASLLFHRAKVRVRGLDHGDTPVDDIASDDMLRMAMCWTVAIGLPTIDTITSADFQARHLLMALQVGEHRAIARSLCLEAVLVSTEGVRQRERAESLLGRARELAEEIDEPELLAWIMAVHGLTKYFWGEWRAALTLLDDAERMVRDRCTGMVWELTCIQYYGAWVRFYLGHVAELTRRVERLAREAEERGDKYAAWGFRSGWSNVRWLVLDDVDGARAAMLTALPSSASQRRFHVQDMENLIAGVNIALYEGDGEAAWQIMSGAWRPMKRAMHLRVQLARVVMHHFRARAALAAAALGGAEADAMVRQAEKDGRKVAAEGLPFGRALGDLVLAGVAALHGDDDDAAALLRAAEDAFEELDMRLYAAAARRRRGELTSSASITADADAWMTGQGIVKPERMVAMLAPGFSNER